MKKIPTLFKRVFYNHRKVWSSGLMKSLSARLRELTLVTNGR